MTTMVERYRKLSDTELTNEERQLLSQFISKSSAIDAQARLLNDERRKPTYLGMYKRIGELCEQHVLLWDSRNEIEIKLFRLGLQRFGPSTPICQECYYCYDKTDDEYITHVHHDCQRCGGLF